MPTKPDFGEMHCSVARSLNIIGESWTLLILRTLLVQGLRKFDEIQQSLGISTNVLAARLARLTDEGLVVQKRYNDRPPRYEYVPTEKALELRPVLLILMAWGNKHLAESQNERPTTIIHNGCAHEMTPRIACSHCGELVIKTGGVSIVPPAKAKATIAALKKQSA